MVVTYKEAKTLPEFVDAIRLRVEVFIREQGFKPGWEPDEYDKTARQFIAVENDTAVATARVRESATGEFKIERMATQKEYRGKGIGTCLLNVIITAISKDDPKRIWLQAQVQAQKFYEKTGFTASSKPYDLHGCPHIDLDYTSLK